MMSFTVTLFTTLVLSVIGAAAETHTIKFDNQCGHGTPLLKQSGKTLSQGEPFTSSGAFFSGIAFLQTGNCNLNGEGCTLIEMSLINPSCPGCGSSTDISLIAPLAFSVPVHFSYFGGCEGVGASCTSASCNTAFFKPDDNQVQVACQANDVNLLITFCPGGAGAAAPSKPSSSAKPTATTKAVVPTVPVTTLQAIVSTSATATPSSSAAVAASSPNVPQCAKNGTARRRRSLQSRTVHSARHSRKRSERAVF